MPKIVEQLAAQPTLAAEDCAKLARETITHGQTLRQAGQPVKPGIVQDGLAAVDQGERIGPKAADWPELRSQLQELLTPPPQQDQKQEEKKNEEQQKEQQQKQEKQSQDQKNEQSQEQQTQEQQQQEQQRSEQQKQQEQAEQQRQQDEKQQSSRQQPQSEPPKEAQTQKIGGEKPKDAELRDHPELAVPLQKLDQVRDQDSPAELFDRLNNAEPRAADQPKKDW